MNDSAADAVFHSRTPDLRARVRENKATSCVPNYDCAFVPSAMKNANTPGQIQFTSEQMAVMLGRAVKNWPQAVETTKVFNEVTTSMPRWEAVAERAEKYRREHPGQPLPSELTGELSNAIGLLDQLEVMLDKLFGSDWPAENREQFAKLGPYKEALRQILEPHRY